MHESEQTVFKLFSSKSSGIPPSLRYGATLAGLRTRRSSKSEGGFRRQRRIPLPEPAKCNRCCYRRTAARRRLALPIQAAEMSHGTADEEMGHRIFSFIDVNRTCDIEFAKHRSESGVRM